MRWLRCRSVPTALLVAAAVALGVWAAGAGQKAAPRGALQTEFSGTVYLPNGQQARKVTLRGAWVAQRGNGQSGRLFDKIITDGQGRYRLRWPMDMTNPQRSATVMPRTYTFLLYSPEGLGYAEVGQAWQGVGPSASLDIHLQEGDRVEGRVVGYPGAKPLAGVQVRAVINMAGGLGHWWQTAEKVTTGREGRFEFKTSLPPKKYDVIAEAPGWPTMIEALYSETAAAPRVEIRLVRPYAIRGHAYGSDGKPLRSRKVELFRYNEVSTGGTGAFSFSPRTWSSPYRGPKYLSRYLTLVPKLQDGRVARPMVVDATDPATQTVGLHFAAPATIQGQQVNARTGKPAAGVQVGLVPVWPGAPLGVWSGLQEGVFDEEHSTIRDDKTGRFVLRGVPPGEYWLQCESWTIHELTAGNGVARRVKVEPGKTLDVGTERVVYAPHLRGRFSGLPWAPDPENNEEELHGLLRPSGGTDPGHEGYVDLWAGGGRYTLWATRQGSGRYDVALVARRGKANYVTRVLHGVALQDDVPMEGIDLAFTRGASISGGLLQAGGKPLAGVPVEARGVGGDAQLFEAGNIYGRGRVMVYLNAKTDRTGAFTIDGLLPGQYELSAFVDVNGYGPRPTLRVHVGAQEQKRGVVLKTQR